MNLRRSPRWAAWLLNRLANESLAGDLTEEFQNGRSRAWFLRQVVFVVLSAAKNPCVNLSALLMAWMIQVFAFGSLLKIFRPQPFSWSLALIWGGLFVGGVLLARAPLIDFWRKIVCHFGNLIALDAACVLLDLPSGRHYWLNSFFPINFMLISYCITHFLKAFRRPVS